jgi:hypothetical protein
VVSARTIRERAVKTVGIGWVREHAAGRLPYGGLADVIRVAAQTH